MMKAIKSSDTIKQKGKTEREMKPLYGNHFFFLLLIYSFIMHS